MPVKLMIIRKRQKTDSAVGLATLALGCEILELRCALVQTDVQVNPQAVLEAHNKTGATIRVIISKAITSILSLSSIITYTSTLTPPSS